ncbi:glycosyltransferase family protein [Schinkia azotoformans]|uniref:hypothetical protein n=1 Tax=Schinkia azotoformans TaxID=1454 RepID=UPI002DB672B8|nr:hypothetical protein [Schinkia azotoformans]MEC1719145.1 hypothetical protein [Schinkia azotoformans]MED4413807.1 hypothetical protein [Schinkia azotoformans]
MKILHAPENIGGMAGVLAREQSRLGHDAISYSFQTNHFKFPSDIVLNNPASKSEKINKAMKFALEFDVFHFYFGSSLLGSGLQDVKWLSKLGKKIFFYFCGCDIRDEKTTIMKYPISACQECFPKLCSANRQLAHDIAQKYGEINFVSTPDLLEFVERSVLLPQVVDFDIIDEIKNENKVDRVKQKDRLTIAHAPTNRLIKGTKYIIDTVESLKSEGLNIELLLIENMTHKDALHSYMNADLAIDQLLVGSYGLLTAELMALGVPTVVYLREDLLEKYDEAPPLINANPYNLKDIIKNIYNNREMLHSYNQRGEEYALKYHHPVPLAIKCLEYYDHDNKKK